MARPTEYEPRISTNVRIPTELADRLHAAAVEREVSANRLITKAIAEYLDRLVPLDDLLRTTDDAHGMVMTTNAHGSWWCQACGRSLLHLAHRDPVTGGLAFPSMVFTEGPSGVLIESPDGELLHECRRG